MCLNIKKYSRSHIAKEDIVVYKHLTYVNGNLKTTYMSACVAIGSTYESEIERHGGCHGGYVERGLHSFAKLTDCEYDGKCERASVIVKCVIPKDSRYYVGEYFNLKSYASNKLTYVEIIKTL